MTSVQPAKRGDDVADIGTAADAVMIRFCGEAFEALPSGGLYWRAERVLLVADLHLEKMSSFTRQGRFLPPYDTGMTLKRLEADLAATGAEKLIALGDSFHRDEGTTTLLPNDKARLTAMMAGVDWHWIAGNHDPAPHTLGGTCHDQMLCGALTLCHEPKRGVVGLMAGHLHPAARIRLNGRSVRKPCFVGDENLFILPAYGSSTGSINILGAAFRGMLNHAQLQVVMMGKDKAYPVSPKHLING